MFAPSFQVFAEPFFFPFFTRLTVVKRKGMTIRLENMGEKEACRKGGLGSVPVLQVRNSRVESFFYRLKIGGWGGG